MTGPEMIDDIAERHNAILDEMMRRDPANVTRKDRRAIVEAERYFRAMFIKDEKKRRRGDES